MSPSEAARAVDAAECRASIAHGRAGAARRSVGRATLASLSAWERAESAAVLAAADADALVAAARAVEAAVCAAATAELRALASADWAAEAADAARDVEVGAVTPDEAERRAHGAPWKDTACASRQDSCGGRAAGGES